MTTLRVRYQTLEFGTADIHIRSLRDNQEFSDNDGAALGISSHPDQILRYQRQTELIPLKPVLTRGSENCV